jgi:hypothetical protein
MFEVNVKISPLVNIIFFSHYFSLRVRVSCGRLCLLYIVLFVRESITCNNMSFIICKMLFIYILSPCISCNTPIMQHVTSHLHFMQHIKYATSHLSLHIVIYKSFSIFVFYATLQICNMSLVIYLLSVTYIWPLSIYASASVSYLI